MYVCMWEREREREPKRVADKITKANLDLMKELCIKTEEYAHRTSRYLNSIPLIRIDKNSGFYYFPKIVRDFKILILFYYF